MTNPTERVAVEQVGMCLNFFRSVIKSGEPWTETCEREFQASQSALTRLRTPEPAGGEPVAWMYERDGQTFTSHNRGQVMFMESDGWTETPLYTHPPTGVEWAQIVDAIIKRELDHVLTMEHAFEHLSHKRKVDRKSALSAIERIRRDVRAALTTVADQGEGEKLRAWIAGAKELVEWWDTGVLPDGMIKARAGSPNAPWGFYSPRKAELEFTTGLVRLVATLQPSGEGAPPTQTGGER